MPIVEYDPRDAFPGVIGRTAEESSSAWPAPVRAKKGAPNVLMIVLDDTGFGQLGCYGSPIETPHLDSLAALPSASAQELMQLAQRVELVLREVYRPGGLNMGEEFAMGHKHGMMLLYAMVQRQAMMLSFNDIYRILCVLMLVLAPAFLFLKRDTRNLPAEAGH